MYYQMPRKYTRKRKYIKKRKRKSPILKAKGPLAQTQIATLNYADEFQLNPGIAGIPNTYVFSCNGLYDPNITGIGHQPRGFDQMMTLYDHYVVIGFKAFISLHNQDGVYANQVVTHIQDDVTTTTDYQDLMERRFIKTKILSPTTGGNDSATMTMSVNPNKWLGRSKPLSDPQLKGSIATNPTEQCYLHLSAFPADNTSDSQAVRGTIRIQYRVMFIEPKQPSKS